MSAASVPLAERRGPARPARQLSDERLARLVAGGDREAFAVIYDRHHQPLYRYCKAILQDGQDAADALQNTMIKALRALPGERRHIALKPWLYRLAHNESVSLMRKRRGEEELSGAAGVEGQSVERDFAARERLGQLMADLQELPHRQRGALLMRELNGLEYSEIGLVLATSPASAKQAVYEARMSLQARVEGRETSCDSIRRTISEHDGRRLRDRGVHAHLRDCRGCRAFEAAIAGRQSQLATIATPLPATAAAALLQSVFGAVGGASGGGGGLAGLSAAGAFSALAAKVVVGAAVATGGVGAAVGGAAILDERAAGEVDSKPAAAAKSVPAAPLEQPRVQNYSRRVDGAERNAASLRAHTRRRNTSAARRDAQPPSGVQPATRGRATLAKLRRLIRAGFRLNRGQAARRRAGRASGGRGGHRPRARRAPRPQRPNKGQRPGPSAGGPCPSNPHDAGRGPAKPGSSPGNQRASGPPGCAPQ